jgi:hypothetical protein
MLNNWVRFIKNAALYKAAFFYALEDYSVTTSLKPLP